jgi:tetratricopeptide (TPR) repeat protein
VVLILHSLLRDFLLEDVLKIFYLVFILLAFVSNAYAETGFFSVQIMTTSKYEDALHHYSGLKNHENARIEKINNAYAVRMGAYQNREEALSLFKELKQIHADALIIHCFIEENRIMQANNLKIKMGVETSESVSQETRVKNLKGTLPQPSSPPSANKTKIIPAAIAVVTELPASTPLNVEEFLKTGIQNHHDRKYDLAISSLSHYISLMPKSRQHVSALLVLGKSFDEFNKPRQALGIFSRIIEKYPESPEAVLSIVAMADIGLAQSELKCLVGLKGSEYVRDPVLGYDTALFKKIPASTIEYVTYQKGRALWKKGQYIESVELMTHLLKEFPNTLYRKDIIHLLKGGTLTLMNQYQQSGDHLSAVHIFFRGRQSGAIDANDHDLLLKLSLSIAHLGLYDEAVKRLSTLRNNPKSVLPSEIENTLAEIEKTKSGMLNQPPRDSGKWDLFESGRAYLTNNNLPLAEQTLSNLKNSGGEPFWSKLSNYALDESKWTQKYIGQVEKK